MKRFLLKAFSKTRGPSGGNAPEAGDEPLSAPSPQSGPVPEIFRHGADSNEDSFEDEVPCVPWFRHSFQDLLRLTPPAEVPWGLFWSKVRDVVTSDNCHYTERWAYDELRLFDDEKRLRFQEVVVARPGKPGHVFPEPTSGLTLEEFEEAVELLPVGRRGLASLFRDVMAKRWSSWMPNG
jgi:hypothetical protein